MTLISVDILIGGAATYTSVAELETGPPEPDQPAYTGHLTPIPIALTNLIAC